MLREITKIKNPENPDYIEKWFTDDYFDLFIWIKNGKLDCFQLIYDKPLNTKALTWKNGIYYHDNIDDGEITGRSKMSPIMISDGICDIENVLKRFLEESKNIPDYIMNMIIPVIKGYKY